MSTFIEQYTTVDKTEWGEGPWQDEGDKYVWVDEKTGLDCMIHRGSMGALCGYVGVPEGHPAYEQNYDDVDVNVHGWLTYADHCQPIDDPSNGVCHIPQPGRPDVWWVGFDCAHGMLDYIPKLVANERKLGFFDETSENFIAGLEESYANLGSYKTIAYVIAEVESLAQQLKGMS